MDEDERFMRMALEEARIAAVEGEVPIGAVVVLRGPAEWDAHVPYEREGFEPRVVSKAHNRREQDQDPAAHAEFLALRRAAQVLGRWRLVGCSVYVTVEPCLMCAGLMVNARVDRCVYGAPDTKGGALGTLYDVSHDERLNHELEVTPGVLGEECAEVMRTFFRERRRAAKAARRAASKG